MMHDAIRGDVLNALRLSAEGDPSEVEVKAITDEMREHLQEFKEQIEIVDQQGVAEVKGQLKNLRGDITAYQNASEHAMKAAFQESSLSNRMG